jgi:acyl carrier protein
VLNLGKDKQGITDFVLAILFELTNERYKTTTSMKEVNKKFDELDMIEMVCDTEFEFKIEIGDDEWENLFNNENTVSTIIDFIGEKCKN